VFLSRPAGSFAFCPGVPHTFTSPVRLPCTSQSTGSERAVRATDGRAPDTGGTVNDVTITQIDNGPYLVAASRATGKDRLRIDEADGVLEGVVRVEAALAPWLDLDVG
jgi:hypothetical protein